MPTIREQMRPLQLLHLPADRIEGEVVAAFFFEDELPLRGPAAVLDWRLNGLLTDLLSKGEIAAQHGERLLVPNNGKLGADRVLFVGGGRWSSLEGDTYHQLIRNLLLTCRAAGFSRVCLALRPIPGEGEEALRAAVLSAVEEIEKGIECLLTVESPEGVRR
jgi:hypothetical protein